ncbi:MAG: molybdenum cofactor cytidylyltransferase [Verrucomicrobiota bacterium]
MVVIGGDREETTNELAKTPATAIENNNWQRGIGTSIRIGVQSAIDKIGTVDKEGRFPKRPTAVGKPPLLGAIVLLTCDQPFVDGKVIKQLITLREKTKNTIVASSYSSTLGVPALFDHSCFPELLALDDKSGAKAIILSNPERVAEFAFPEGRIDIDTTEDLERLKETGSSRME